MDLDRDEGYISPQESVEGQAHPGSAQPNSALSWTSSFRSRYRSDELGNKTECYSLESLTDSSLVTDHLWLTLPESQSSQLRSRPGVVKNEPRKPGGIEPLFRVAEIKRIQVSSLVRDILDMVCGKPSLTFPQENETSFKKNPGVLVEGLTPTALFHFCEPFVQTGTLVMKLNCVDDYFHFQTSVLGENESSVWVRLVKFIQDFLRVYRTFIMLNRPSILTLTGLRRFMQPFQQQIRTLWDIIDAHVFANPTLLLKNLNDFMMKTEVPWICQLLQNMLVSCAAAYTKYVADWIFRGELKSQLEFHIRKSRKPVLRDRQFWTHQFAQDDDIPLFLHHLKSPIFETGRAFSLLRELHNNKLPSCLEYNTDLVITLEISHASILRRISDQEEKLAIVFQKYSYIQEQIDEAITLSSARFEPVDASAMQRSAFDCASRSEAERLERLMREREVKRIKMAEILEDMEQARISRVRKAIDDIFEDKKIEETRREMLASQRGAEILNRLYGVVMDSLDSQISNMPTSHESGDTLAPTDILPSPTLVISQTSEAEILSSGGGDGERADGVTESETYFTAKMEISSASCNGIPELPLEKSGSESVLASTSEPELNPKSVVPFRLELEMLEAPLLPVSTDCKSESTSTFFEENEVFLTNRLLSLSVEIPLMAQNKLVNLALLHLIIVDKQLLRHLQALQDYVLVQNGLFGQFLTSALIEKIDSKLLKADLATEILSFNEILDDVLLGLVDSDEMTFLKRMRFDIAQETSPKKEDSKCAAPGKQIIRSDYEVLNSVALRYRVEWPLNIILTEEFLKKYERAFDLQMRLYRVELLLGKSFLLLKYKARSAQLLELNHYRHHMLHFVRSLQSYVNMVVIHPSWTELNASLPAVGSMEGIYDLLVHYIKTLSSNCLLGPKARPIMKLLTSQLLVIEAFCSKLDSVIAGVNFARGQTVKPKDFKALNQHYLVFQQIQAVFTGATFKASQKGYYPKISLFVELFNFNDFHSNCHSSK